LGRVYGARERPLDVNVGRGAELIVLGIDPGLARTGYGVIATEKGRAEALAFGCISTGTVHSREERLLQIHDGVTGLIDRFGPAEIAVERLFFTKNTSSGIEVAEARGVILLAAGRKRIPVAEYTPNQVKQAVTGSGRADKLQVQEMVKRLLSLRELPRPDDAADGLSIALCHLHSTGR
jgi:crossover junction endodeoxyribonuclease RuvC